MKPLPSPLAALLAAVVVTALDAPVRAQVAAEPPALAPATPTSQGLDPAALRELADIVRGYVEKDHALGGELLVVRNRRVVLHEAYGLRDRETDAPMRLDTIFNVRSMTKPLTGAAAQVLIDEGRLGLDDRAARYLPGFRNEKSEMITVEQLLTHRSGLPLTALTTSMDEHPDLQTLANAVGERGPEFGPGSRFWYSDAGSEVLGAIVEVVSGEKLDAFVETRLLRPLAMTDSFYLTPVTEDDPRTARVASLYGGASGNWSRFWTPASGALYPFAWGSQTLYSTPRDYARFLSMWMDDGRVGAERILSKAAIERTLTPVSPATGLGSSDPAPTFFPGVEVWYGQMSMLYMDPEAAEGAPPIVIGHGGSDGTMAWAWPELDLMVLYFTQSRGGLSVLRLEDEIDRLLIHPGRPRRTAEVKDEHRPYLGPYVANFGPFRDVEFTVLVQNGRLAVDIPGQLVFELKEPDDEGRRSFVMTDDVAVSFERDDDGNVTLMKMHQGGMTFDLPKGTAQPRPEVVLDPASLAKYAGTYYDEQVDRNVEIIVRDGTLAIEVPGQPMAFELYPPDEDGLWSLRLNVSVRLRFDEDENGRVVSYTVVLPDGSEAVRPRVEAEDDEG